MQKRPKECKETGMVQHKNATVVGDDYEMLSSERHH